MRYAEKARISLTTSLEKREGEVSYYECEVRCLGDAPAYFVNIRDKNMAYAILADDQYFTLLPGEARKVKIMLRERTGLFFERPDKMPELYAYAINGGEK